MKMAITSWNGRIAPVFDVSRQVVVMEAKGGRIINRQEHDLESSEPSAKVIRLTELGIDTLICGAVSRPLADMIVARGIKLIPFVAGETDQVAEAYLAGSLMNTAFAMPGCCGRQQGFRGPRGGRGMGGCFGRKRTIM
ncbi:MAG: NifB/NifX family molybdenum-iron cluster-binding protein [Kiritimatiellia bacterium]|nr:NifB/NifX family molybdenum-iron cluster-binding protein [Kiritimatiellia bacterium]